MSDLLVRAVPGSPYARSVMATLEEKQASWLFAPMAPGESKQPAHLARHPFGKVPVLEHGDFVLYETQAILRYLDRVIPHVPLTPTSPTAIARMDQLMGINDCYLFPGCATVIVFERVVGPALFGRPANEDNIRGAMPKAQLVFEQLQSYLGEEPFLTGSELSLADLLIAPQLEFFARTPEWDTLTAERPQLRDWLARMESRPSFRKTLWERLVDLPQAA